MDAPPFPGAAIDAARAALKAELRIADNNEDAALTQVVTTALTLAEAFTGRAWIARQWQELLPASRAWQALTPTPVTAITSVQGLPAEGAGFALAPEAYAIDIDADGIGWVRLAAPSAAGRVHVTFTAGAADGWDALPAPIAQGVVLLAAHLFGNREGAAPPAAVTALWRPWRRMRLSAGEHAA